VKKLLVALALANLYGCASIVSGTSQSVSIKTTQNGTEFAAATCKLENDKGIWYVPVSPGSVVIHRSFNDLTISCEKPGAPTGVSTFSSSAIGMAAGNILLGGAIGVGVDMASGAAFEYPNLMSVEMGVVAKKPIKVANQPPETPVEPEPVGPYAMTSTAPSSGAPEPSTSHGGFVTPTSEFGSGDQSLIPRNRTSSASPPPESIRFKTPLSEFGSGEQSPVPRVAPAAPTATAQASTGPLAASNGAPTSSSGMVQVKYQGLANNFVEQSSCSVHARTELKMLGSDSEIYAAPCDNGDRWLIKCDARNCHVLK